MELINKVLLGDCLEVMKDIPEKSIDAIITDPPYMTTDLNFDKVGFDVDRFCIESLRVLKDNGYFVSFGSLEILAKFLQYFQKRFQVVWLKNQGGINFKTTKKPTMQHDLIVVYCKKNCKIKELTFNRLEYKGKPYTRIRKSKEIDSHDAMAKCLSYTSRTQDTKNKATRWQTDVIEAPKKNAMKYWERTEHPTQKPLRVMETLIKWTTNENDIVLDPFAGSGSTLIACRNTKRKFIGVEIDEYYYKMINQRLIDTLELWI